MLPLLLLVYSTAFLFHTRARLANHLSLLRVNSIPTCITLTANAPDKTELHTLHRRQSGCCREKKKKVTHVFGFFHFLNNSIENCFSASLASVCSSRSRQTFLTKGFAFILFDMRSSIENLPKRLGVTIPQEEQPAC